MNEFDTDADTESIREVERSMPVMSDDARSIADYLSAKFKKGGRVGWVSNWRPHCDMSISISFYFFDFKLAVDMLMGSKREAAKTSSERRRLLETNGYKYVSILPEGELDTAQLLEALR